MSLPFQIIIQPTSEQIKKIPYWNHTNNVEEVAKKIMFKNYAGDHKRIGCYIAQDEQFIYISKNKNCRNLSKCMKSDNVKYCKEFFCDNFEALTDEEIETRQRMDDERFNKAQEEIKKSGGLDIRTYVIYYDPKTQRWHE